MFKSYSEQKATEKRLLEAARTVSPTFPLGEVELFEEPDLRIKTKLGFVYVEVTELIRPKTEMGFTPVAVEAFHKKIVQTAESIYQASNIRKPRVSVYFHDELQWKLQNPREWDFFNSSNSGRKIDRIAQSLAEFVEKHYEPGAGPVTFSQRRRLPMGFSTICISEPTGSWQSGESATILQLEREQLSTIIQKKNKLLPSYRHRVNGTPLWLLIASGISVSRGVPIPRDIQEWTFESGFDKVLLFSGMDNRVLLIRNYL